MKRIFLFAMLALTFASCQTGHNHDEAISNPGGQDHEGTKNQFTAYSNAFELFAEADPFVLGHTANVLSHFSNLPDFTALENGSITLRLIVDGKEVSQTLERPTRKGIYSFDIKPDTKGKGILLFDILTEKGSFQVKVMDVQVFAEEHNAIHNALEIELPTLNTTVFTKEQSWKIEFATELPKIKAFGPVIKTTAQIQSGQGDEILVSAKTNGIIMLSNKYVLEGKRVSTGDILFLISGDGLADNNLSVQFAEAKSNFEKAKSDFDRVSALAQDKIVSERELADSKNQFEKAKVIYENLQGNFNPKGQRIVSPMSGFVKRFYVQNGQYVEAGQPIVSISGNKTLLLRADVQQKYASLLGTINSANIRTLEDNKMYTLSQLNGKVLSFGRSTNEDNYLIPVSIQIDNIGSFISGGFVELYLKTQSDTKALTIPNSALLEEQGFYFIFVQITPELFEKREVKIGGTDGLKTRIIKGIKLNERIVTKGAILIKLSQVSGALDAHSGHVH